jgi:hypothetical protein
MRIRLLALTSALLIATGVQAAEKTTRFWNLTAKTVTSLRLAPAGTDKFGTDLCANDKDGSVDHDERLKVPNLASGQYDAKIGYADGRICTVKNMAIETGKVFSIEDKDLTACNK